MDFRSEAAAATFQQLNATNGAALAELGESGCLAIPGGRRSLCIIEVSHFIVTLLLLLASLAMLPLALLGGFPRHVIVLVLAVMFVASLLIRLVKSLILKAFLARRADGLVKLCSHLPGKTVGLEEGRTHKKLKLVPEDRGICRLDAQSRRLLLEGCAYRYVIYARDVFSVQPVSGYALSGARLVCRMAGQPLDLVLMADGYGPLASLIQAFDPSTVAQGLATTLNQTLFGVQTAVYQQRELPPPLTPKAPGSVPVAELLPGSE